MWPCIRSIFVHVLSFFWSIFWLVETLILGIDPGSRVTGYGLIRCSGSDHELLEA
ncbi:MAG: crossover junction endodeoxyribonuclease RuvC, partial [Bacteroidota bacterium]